MNAIAPAAYLELIEDIDALMARARALGCWRTGGELHTALMTARGEIWEAIPPITVQFLIGPIQTQPERS